MAESKNKKKGERARGSLSSMQEILYSHEFKLADQAGHYSAKHAKH